MATITVEATPEQEEYINALCRELGGVTPGALLLSQAFECMSMNNPVEDATLPGFIVALKLFVVDRRLPILRVESLNGHTVGSRPARKSKKGAAA